VAGTPHQMPQCGVPNEPGALFCSRCGASSNRPGYAGTRRRGVSAAGFAMALALLLPSPSLCSCSIRSSPACSPPPKPPSTLRGHPPAPSLPLPPPPPARATDSTGTDGRRRSHPGASRQRHRVLVADATLISGLPAHQSARWRSASAWNEGADGPGIGEWVLYDFGEPVPLAAHRDRHGYQP